MRKLPQVIIKTQTGALLSSNDSNPNEVASNIIPSFSTSKSVVLPPNKILRDFDKFFAYCGGVLHPKKRDKQNRPIRVLKPTWYQSKFAKMDRAVMLASNKIGKTMSESIVDVQTRLFPEHAGFDVLLVGQNQLIADQHLLDLKRWMIGSPRMKPYLVLKPNSKTKLREEKSKMSQLYIENPYKPEAPSRIIAIGFSESLAYSWKNIDRVHISDPGMIKRKNQQQFFSGLFSRLTNTEGQIKIEGVAGDRSGYFWELCRKLFPEHMQDQHSDFEDMIDPDRLEELQMEEFQTMQKSFEKMFVTVDAGLKAGVVTQQWLDFMKGILPREEFERLYYCKFRKPEGAIFGDFKTGEHDSLDLVNL